VAVLGAAAAVASGLALAPVGANAAPVKSATTAAYHVTRPKLPAGEHYMCSLPTQPGQMMCDSIYVTAKPGNSADTPDNIPGGYSPRDLRAAYRLTTASRRRGRGVTVAIVDAYNDPRAGSDLAVYRQRYGLPKCTKKNGCLKIVNQNGSTRHLPGNNGHWAGEESLDLDTVSAICPLCKIVLVEAKNTFTNSLGPAENTAARMARFVSNSWSGGNFTGERSFNHYFKHPGHVIDFAAGDFGYGTTFPDGTAYPTDLPIVTAVGGTKLVHQASRGFAWTQTVWNEQASGEGATNSGCTRFARPSWQKRVTRNLRGCRTRVENDVAADGDPTTGIRIYDSFQSGVDGPWFPVGGTSEATPLITAIYALAGRPGAHAYPVSYLYKHVRDFYDVQKGNNGRCRVKWICQAKKGFDGPTGLGTPLGIGGMRK